MNRRGFLASVVLTAASLLHRKAEALGLVTPLKPLWSFSLRCGCRTDVFSDDGDAGYSRSEFFCPSHRDRSFIEFPGGTRIRIKRYDMPPIEVRDLNRRYRSMSVSSSASGFSGTRMSIERPPSL